MNYGFIVGRPSHFDGIQQPVFLSKPDIRRAVRLRFRIVEAPAATWVGPSPSTITSSVDRFPIHFQPKSNVSKHILDIVGDGAVSLGAYIQEQISILANDIDQLMNDQDWGDLNVSFSIYPHD